jgi:hypothetical protein
LFTGGIKMVRALEARFRMTRPIREIMKRESLDPRVALSLTLKSTQLNKGLLLKATEYRPWGDLTRHGVASMRNAEEMLDWENQKIKTPVFIKLTLNNKFLGIEFFQGNKTVKNTIPFANSFRIISWPNKKIRLPLLKTTGDTYTDVIGYQILTKSPFKLAIASAENGNAIALSLFMMAAGSNEYVNGLYAPVILKRGTKQETMAREIGQAITELHYPVVRDKKV